MSDLNIRKVLDNISNGNIRIPTFQRGFVWEAESIAFLMDSIYKGYPFGTIQLWRTREQLKCEKKIGNFEIFNRDEDYPIDYVLDGQQRLTSIFGVFQTEIEVDQDEDNPFNIYFDLDIEDNSQDSQFVAFGRQDKIDIERYFPLNVLFDTVKYRNATEHFSDVDTIKRIDKLQEKFKEVSIPNQTLETNDKSKVAIVFERINRRGVELDTLQLLIAWTWSEEFDLQSKFEDLKQELEPHGFESVGTNVDLLLKITSAVISHNSNTDELILLNGETVRARFEEIRNGILGSIDFLKKNFKIESIKNLPYEHFLIPMSVFFSIEGNRQLRTGSIQYKKIISWFWKSSFNKRYASSTNRKVNDDIKEMLVLKDNPTQSRIDQVPFNTVNADLFKEEVFGMNRVTSKAFVLLLVQNDPRNLVSGGKISLGAVLKEYNKNEFHHIFPKAYLDSLDENQKRYDKNCLANYCILSRTENNLIKDKKPSKYYADHMDQTSDKVLECAFIDKTAFINDDFQTFIDKRAESLMVKLNEVINT